MGVTVAGGGSPWPVNGLCGWFGGGVSFSTDAPAFVPSLPLSLPPHLSTQSLDPGCAVASVGSTASSVTAAAAAAVAAWRGRRMRVGVARPGHTPRLAAMRVQKRRLTSVSSRRPRWWRRNAAWREGGGPTRSSVSKVTGKGLPRRKKRRRSLSTLIFSFPRAGSALPCLPSLSQPLASQAAASFSCINLPKQKSSAHFFLLLKTR